MTTESLGNVAAGTLVRIEEGDMFIISDKNADAPNYVRAVDINNGVTYNLRSDILVTVVTENLRTDLLELFAHAERDTISDCTSKIQLLERQMGERYDQLKEAEELIDECGGAEKLRDMMEVQRGVEAIRRFLR
jgi:hypothetical protein